MKHIKSLVLLLSVLLISGAVIYLNPSILNNIGLPNSNTLVSASTQWVDTSDGTGQYWNLQAAVSMQDTYTGVKFDSGQTATATVNGIQTALKSTASIQIQITPGTPYAMRNIVQKTTTVCNGASESISSTSGNPTQGGTKVGLLTATYWMWSGDWSVYAPYTVTVYKDGQQIGSQVYNDYQSDRVVNIPTSFGNVRIENLGMLQGNYGGKPSTPASVAIFSGNEIFDYNTIKSAMTIAGTLAYDSISNGYTGGDAYSKYWYGDKLFADQTHKSTIPQIGGTNAASLRATAYDQYGGWKSGSSSTDAIPVKPVIFQSEKSSQGDTNAQSKMCLTEYLKNSYENYASTIFSGYSNYQFVSGGTNSNGEQVGALKLFIAQGSAYATSLVNIRFPIALADTIVDQPPVGSFSLSAAWESTGTTTVTATGNQKLDVVVSNSGDAAATCDLKLTCGNTKVGLFPATGSVTVAAKGQETATFVVSNLGVVSQETSIPITISGKDAYSGKETTTTVYITLAPTLNTGSTILDVYAIEKQNSTQTGKQVPIKTGLSLQVLYPSDNPTENMQAFTGNGGMAEFNLKVADSGNFVGSVLVKSAADDTYKAATATLSVDNGINTLILEVERQDSTYDNAETNWILIAAIVIVIVIVVAGVGIYVKTRKGSRRRRR